MRSYDKLAAWFCGHVRILKRIRPVANKLALLPYLRNHNVFHVSLLKRYIHDSTHINDCNLVQVEPESEFHVEPIHILDRKKTTLWNRVIAQVKVKWKHFIPDKATSELDD